MSCNHPHLAVRLGVRENGKSIIKILPKSHFLDNLASIENKYGKDNILLLPCGHCTGCKLDYRKSWAVRCCCESFYHKSSVFVTLTYDDKNCPKKLRKSDLQSFIKSVRNYGYKFRYFACGEYGSKTYRPHYHIIMFGFKPDDMKYDTKSSNKFAIFRSEFVSKIWNKGLVTVQNFEPGCAAYVAGYVDKKLNRDDGFLLMSKKPGLGYQYAVDNLEKIYKYDKLVDDFGSYKVVKPPRFFDKVAEVNGIDLESVRLNRKDGLSDYFIRLVNELGLSCKDEVFNIVRFQNDLRMLKLVRKGV